MAIKYLIYETLRYAPPDGVATATAEHKNGKLVYIGRLAVAVNKQCFVARIWRGRVEDYFTDGDSMWYRIRPVPDGAEALRISPYFVCATRDAAKKKIVELIDTFQVALIALEKKL